ncbi:MAG: hypothetical protein KAJ91_01905 [Candidatus Aenigmarchaeota archaeon]|nr:hypothetical protein [Candidatus Aenigmarchaeota archaeon]
MCSEIWYLKIFWEIIKKKDLLKKLFSPTKYLNYDPLFLCSAYEEETPIKAYLPYKQEVCWIRSTWEETCNAVNNISIQKTSPPFNLGTDLRALKAFQGLAYHEFKASGKITKDSNIIRLDSLKINQKETKLTVQKAKYSDQVQSNLVMDWTDNHALKELGVATLRAYFTSRYPQRLPPLSDTHLANTIGIAVILFYQNSSMEYVPYIPQRAKGLINNKKILAVFEGGYHCTASGAAEWSESENFNQCITKDMYEELREEVGIERDDVEVMLPVALCREFLRGGKPQIFFAGLTKLSEKQLGEKRKSAIKMQNEMKDKVEIEDNQLIVSDIDHLKKSAQFFGLTLEAIANLHYAEKFINMYLPNRSRIIRKAQEKFA